MQPRAPLYRWLRTLTIEELRGMKQDLEQAQSTGGYVLYSAIGDVLEDKEEEAADEYDHECHERERRDEELAMLEIWSR